MRTSAAIEARDLTKTYGKDVRALDGLGFAVEAGVDVLAHPERVRRGASLGALCLACTWLATRGFRTYQRSI